MRVVCGREDRSTRTRFRTRHLNGLARAAALALAESACRHAGDSGFVRLRAMALLVLTRILGEEEGAAARARALQIARRIEDEELLWRGERLAPR
ncbi:hypothetical protein WMF45_48820 [Sorangium sp. So ce448]|uniref:hypothetical protein n=1 Tax=Sorangium sp. So ce448 TaxID=3133314 RepID=UPI003F613E61